MFVCFFPSTHIGVCAIYRPCLKNGMLKVSQIQLSHAVTAPILIGDCAQVVLEVLLLFLYVSLGKEVIFIFPLCNEREQTGTLQTHHQERERGGGEKRRR